MWRRHLLLVCLLIAPLSCRPDLQIIRPTIIRLATGDSVLFVATVPMVEPQGDTGMVYEYHPFIPLTDTLALRSQAFSLWYTVRPRADSLQVPFVVLLATTKFTEDRRIPQSPAFQNYGFIFEKRDDGRWHILNAPDSIPE